MLTGEHGTLHHGEASRLDGNLQQSVVQSNRLQISFTVSLRLTVSTNLGTADYSGAAD
jgi:hypothetical protein